MASERPPNWQSFSNHPCRHDHLGQIDRHLDVVRQPEEMIRRAPRGSVVIDRLLAKEIGGVTIPRQGAQTIPDRMTIGDEGGEDRAFHIRRGLQLDMGLGKEKRKISVS